MFRTVRRLCLLAICLLGVCTSAQAWGPQGHQLIADLVTTLIQGRRAERELKDLLGSMQLRDLAVWADCVKGIGGPPAFANTVPGRFPECAVFETPAETALMRDFVRRNLDACRSEDADEACHKQYHYADVALQRDRYQRGSAGTSDHDVVAALQASIAVLQGQPAPEPISLTSRREALALLVHLVGDIHQPLHVGAIYLDAQGQVLDPDALDLHGQALFAASNRGGNAIALPGGNLHAYWDLAPRLLSLQDLSELPALAAHVPADSGPVSEWPVHWAGQSVQVSTEVFKGLEFSARRFTAKGPQWSSNLPDDYAQRCRELTRLQLARAGAHLAELLMALWPQAPR